MSFAKILEDAAFTQLSAAWRLQDVAEPQVWHSCNAIYLSTGSDSTSNNTSEHKACRNWYVEKILDGYCPAWTIGEECGEESQNVRFMLLMFASYLAADEGL